MNRIRYRETGVAGVLSSVKIFNHSTNGSKFQVFINETNMSFKILDLATGEPFHTVIEGTAPSMAKVKIEAKKALSNLGIDTGDVEKRTRKLADENQAG